MHYKIIPLLLKHETDWRALWQAYLAFYKQPLPEETTLHTFARLCTAKDGLKGYALLTENDKMIGFVHTLYHANTWSISPKCYLEDLYVAEEFRGRHLGRALIEHVYKTAYEAGCIDVYWHTQQDNYTARKLYDRIAELSDFVRYRKQLKD